MRLHYIEAVQAVGDGDEPFLSNWGKFAVGTFDAEEWERRSALPAAAGQRLLSSRGWGTDHRLVLDLQTGEGAIFRMGGHARADLNKQRIWVCPLFEPFLQWLYEQPSDGDLPRLVVLPDAPFEMRGYRRAGQCPHEVRERLHRQRVPGVPVRRHFRPRAVQQRKETQ